MTLSQYLPKPKPFFYGTTLAAATILETKDELDMLLVAEGSEHLDLPLYCRAKIGVEGLSEDERKVRIEEELELMIEAMTKSIHEYAVRQGLDKEE